MEINNKILEEYFSYLTVIKARSPHTIAEFRVDLRLLFIFVLQHKKPLVTPLPDCSFADINFIKSITLNDIYAFIAYLQKIVTVLLPHVVEKLFQLDNFGNILKKYI